MSAVTPKQHEVMKPSGHYPEPWLIPKRFRWVYRFLLGRPMDNQIRTDGTFWHRAQGGYPSRWLRLAGWERAAIRLSVTYVLAWVVLVAVAAILSRGVSLMGWTPPGVLQALAWRTVLEVHLLGSLGVLVPLGTYRRVRDYGLSVRVPVLEVTRVPGVIRVRCHVAGWVPLEVHGRKTWELEKVRPVAAVAAASLALSYRPETAGRWVHVPRNYRDPEGDPVVVMLPANFSGADPGHMKRLASAVANRLGMRDPIVSWELSGSQPRLVLRTSPTPPTLAVFADYQRFFVEAVEFRPFLGIVTEKSGVYAEMVKDSPHIGLSAASGAGKSELVKAIIMQCLRWGWGVVILDWKEVSHEWADGLRGVKYVRDVADIHDALVGLQGELDDRKTAYRQDKTLPGRAKVLVVYEEMNATSELLTTYWANLRSTAEKEERRTMPVRSPAIQAQNALVFGGRQFGLFCLFMAQRFSNRVTQGNTDVRENFAIKLLARYSQNTVKMLCPEIKPFPRKPTNVGGWVAVMGDEAVTFQGILITDEEAREFASGGVENPSHPLTTSYYPAVSERQNEASTLENPFRPVGTSAPALTDQEAPLEATVVVEKKLSEMVEGLTHLGVTLAVLQKAARADEQGDPTFPGAIGGAPNRGYTYDFQAVLEWARRRHAQRSAEKEARQ